MLLEKKPNLTLKNKKGQTPIDLTNNKLMISTFSLYLSKKSPEEPKSQKDTPRLPEEKKKNIKNLKEISEKMQIKVPALPQGYEAKQKEKIKVLQGPKKHAEVYN